MKVWVYGDNVNTELIFPGKYTYTLKTQAEIAAHALEDLDPAFCAGRPTGRCGRGRAQLGCGSSREQASPRSSGRASRDHRRVVRWAVFRNCINQGVRPIVLPGLAALLENGRRIEIDGDTITVGDEPSCAEAVASVQAILDAGGLAPMLQRGSRRRRDNLFFNVCIPLPTSPHPSPLCREGS